MIARALEGSAPPATLLEALADELGDPGASARAVPPETWRRVLAGPLEDFLSRPGKQFRAQLARAAWSLAGCAGTPPPQVENLLEALHAGSLIVDDIEDGSNTRRGRPSLHVQHGVPVALNAGNWLYFWALSQLDALGAGPAAHALVHRTLLRCHQGQALDVGVRVETLQQADVAPVALAIADLKTGCLAELAATLGPVCAGASAAHVEALGRFGRELGRALQQLDDLGGITSEAFAHKGLEDVRHGRVTWAWARVAEDLDELGYRRLRQLAVAVSRGEEPPADLAAQLEAHLPAGARDDVRKDLEGAFARLAQAVGNQPALQLVQSEITRLEKSYG